jgi:hypothetical protein
MVRLSGSRSRDLNILVLFAFVPLSGCMGMRHPPEVAPPPVGSALHPASAPRSAAIKPKKSALPHDLRPSDADDSSPPARAIRAASVDPQSLMGLDPDSVQKRLGAPMRMQNGTLSREWIYSAQGCSFSIFFYPNVDSTSFRALKYGSTKDNGEPIDGADACVRKILVARNNAE